MFRAQVLISQPVHGTATYRREDTRDCIVQFWPPDDERYGAVRCGWCRKAPSAPYTRPTQRLSRPPPTQKLGTENHMLQL